MIKRTILGQRINIAFAVISFALLSFISCKKDTEVNKDTFKIEKEEVKASSQSN